MVNMTDPDQWNAYDVGQARGVAVLVTAGFLSLLSVMALLIMMGVSGVGGYAGYPARVSACRTEGSPGYHIFYRTQVAAYFVSLLLCDLTQGVGSIINIAWINDMGVTNGHLCIAQAAIKQTGNVGTALWTLVLAIHTFFLLFYHTEVPDWVCCVVLVTVWLILGIVLSLGPGVIATPAKGPFYGISGLWCWVTPAYPIERYTLEYLFMFTSAGLSFFLYSLVFLRLRGNVVVNGWRFSFQRRVVARGVRNRRHYAVTDLSQNTQVLKVARQMMWYPVAYTILVVPIAAARFASFNGSPVPYQVTIFTATILMLSGFVNAILFTTTRRVLPANSMFLEFIRQRFGISTGSGMNTQTHQQSFTNTGTSNRRSRNFPDVRGIGIGVNVGRIMEYDHESPSLNGSRPMTERPFRPFNAVAAFSQQSFGPSTAAGRQVIWNDHSPQPSNRRHGYSVGSSILDISGVEPGESSLPNAPQYPSPPSRYNQTNRFLPSTFPNIAAYLNPRDRGDRTVLLNDQGPQPSNRRRGSSVCSSILDISGVDPGEISLPNAPQYPSPPSRYNQTDPFPPSASLNIADCLNPRGRGDRSMTAAYAYRTEEYTPPRDRYAAHHSRGI